MCSPQVQPYQRDCWQDEDHREDGRPDRRAYPGPVDSRQGHRRYEETPGQDRPGNHEEDDPEAPRVKESRAGHGVTLDSQASDHLGDADDGEDRKECQDQQRAPEIVS